MTSTGISLDVEEPGIVASLLRYVGFPLLLLALLLAAFLLSHSAFPGDHSRAAGYTARLVILTGVFVWLLFRILGKAAHRRALLMAAAAGVLLLNFMATRPGFLAGDGMFKTIVTFGMERGVRAASSSRRPAPEMDPIGAAVYDVLADFAAHEREYTAQFDEQKVAGNEILGEARSYADKPHVQAMLVKLRAQCDVEQSYSPLEFLNDDFERRLAAVSLPLAQKDAYRAGWKADWEEFARARDARSRARLNWLAAAINLYEYADMYVCGVQGNTLMLEDSQSLAFFRERYDEARKLYRALDAAEREDEKQRDAFLLGRGYAWKDFPAPPGPSAPRD